MGRDVMIRDGTVWYGMVLASPACLAGSGRLRRERAEEGGKYGEREKGCHGEIKGAMLPPPLSF